MRLFFSFCLLLLFYGCQKSTDAYEPIFDKYSNAEITYLNLNETVDIYLNNSEDAIEVTVFDSSEQIGINYIQPINEKFVAIESGNKTISLMHSNGVHTLNRISSIGRGPGEFENINSIIVNDEHIYIIDNSLSKVIKYNQSLEFIDEVILEGLNAFKSDITIVNNNLVYPFRSNDLYLFGTLDLDSNSISDKNILNRVISIGKLPQSYNDFIPSSSNSSDLAFLSHYMPLIFYYHNSDLYSPKTIYRLVHEELDIINRNVENSIGMGDNIIHNPPPTDIERTDSRIGLTQLFNDILLTDKYVFIVHSNNKLTLLERNNDNLEMINTFHFLKKENEVFKIENVAYTYPWIYLSSMFEDDYLKVDVNNLTKY